MAIHRVFDSPTDRVVFDTGHQAYVHKLLTGRMAGFEPAPPGGRRQRLPQPGRVRARHRRELPRLHRALVRRRAGQGLRDPRRGPPRRRGHRRRRAHRRHGLGGAQQHRDRPQQPAGHRRQRQRPLLHPDRRRARRPRSPALRTSPRYEQVLDLVKKRLNAVRGVGPAAYDALHAMKKGMKDALAPQGLFEDLGLKYVGPVDGHDRAAMEQVLAQAKRFDGPVIVHALTRKGFGYDAAERHEADQFHSPGPFDVETGEENPKGRDLDRRLRRRDRPHRPAPPGRRRDHRRDDAPGRAATSSRRSFPERTFDVGIAEQHAATSAAGLAMGGLHPVVAVYATFLNRAFDQVLMDCALHRCGVTFVLDRAGVTGDDGASHNGMWDMSVLQVVPGLRLAAPRDGARLRELLGEAVEVDDAPTVVRFPKGPPPDDIEAVDRAGGVDVLRPQRHQGRAGRRRRRRWPRPPSTWPSGWSPRASASPSSTRAGSSRSTRRSSSSPREHGLVVSVEDNGRVGGCGRRSAADAQRRRRAPRRSGCTASRRSSSTTPSARRSSSGSGSTPRPSPAASSRTSPPSPAPIRARRRPAALRSRRPRAARGLRDAASLLPRGRAPGGAAGGAPGERTGSPRPRTGPPRSRRRRRRLGAAGRAVAGPPRRGRSAPTGCRRSWPRPSPEPERRRSAGRRLRGHSSTCRSATGVVDVTSSRRVRRGRRDPGVAPSSWSGSTASTRGRSPASHVLELEQRRRTPGGCCDDRYRAVPGQRRARGSSTGAQVRTRRGRDPGRSTDGPPTRATGCSGWPRRRALRTADLRAVPSTGLVVLAPSTTDTLRDDGFAVRSRSSGSAASRGRSTTATATRHDPGRAGPGDAAADRRRLLNLIRHEFAHVAIGQRDRPDAALDRRGHRRVGLVARRPDLPDR